MKNNGKVLLIAMSILMSIGAWAQGAAQSATTSDLEATVWNPKIEFGEGRIETRKLQIDGNLSGFQNSEGQLGMGFYAGLTGPIVYTYGETENLYGAVLSSGWLKFDFSTEVAARLKLAREEGRSDAEEAELIGINVRSPSLSLVAVQSRMLSRAEYDPNPDLTPEQRRNLSEFSNEYHVASGSIDILKVRYDLETNEPLGFVLNSAAIEALSVNGHFAFTVAGVNVDLCANANVGGKVGSLQYSRDGESTSSAFTAGAGACIGLGLDKIVNLRYNIDVEGTFSNIEKIVGDEEVIQERNIVSVVQTARAADIGGTGLYLYYQYANESRIDQSGPSRDSTLTTHSFGLGMAQ